MATPLRKPVTRSIMVDGQLMNVSLDYSGVTFHFYRSRKSGTMLLPYSVALIRAAMLCADAKMAARAGVRKPRKHKTRRGAV